LAGLGLKLNDRERFDGVDTEFDEVLDAVDHVEEGAVPPPPIIVPLGIAPEVGPDVELVNDQVVEGRRAEPLVMPGKRVRIADNAVSRQTGHGDNFAGARVAQVRAPRSNSTWRHFRG